jgi:ATP-dependent Clp protease ATP-binding subunit ClpA
LDPIFSEEAKLFYDQGLVIAQRQKRPDLASYYILQALKDHPETEDVLNAADMDWKAFSSALQDVEKHYPKIFPAPFFDQKKDIRDTAKSWAVLKKAESAGVQDLFLACCHAIAPSLDLTREMTKLDEAIVTIHDKSLRVLSGDKSNLHIFVPDIENLDTVDKRLPAPLEDGPDSRAEASEARDAGNDDEVTDNLVLTQADHNALLKYCVYMNTQTFPPFSGREAEQVRLSEALLNIRKRNALVIGDEGIGKTAIVEGLVQNVMQGKYWPSDRPIPDFYNLDINRIVAGAKHHGELEERLQQVIDVAAKYPGQCILFIDEVHKLVGTGVNGSMDAANILKPALSRGLVTAIGATTLDEHRKYIEKDRALARRFAKIFVEEPDRAATLQILVQSTTDLVAGHNVLYPRSALEAAYDMAKRYLAESHMPDIAFDVLDSAGVKARKRAGYTAERTKVLKSDVAAVVSERSGIPVADLADDHMTRVIYLEDFLKDDVKGQDEALRVLGDAVRVSLAGLRSDRKTQGAFLLSGPTGVGKTEAGRALAKHTGMNLIRVDMSEYMEKHNVARFIGSPPGYVGYRDSGTIADQIRRRPYSVLLLDEVEKAHPDVFNILLQIMDDGAFTDGEGRKVDCRNIMVFMTTNAGEAQRRKAGIGFAAAATNDKAPEEAVKKLFSAEFRNRLDAVVTFGNLNAETLRQISDLMLERFSVEQKQRQSLTLTFTEKARKAVAANGTNAEFGARPLSLYIQTNIKVPLAIPLLKKEVQPGDTVVVDFSRAGNFTFTASEGLDGEENSSADIVDWKKADIAPGRRLN